jgi:hypothetical protein
LPSQTQTKRTSKTSSRSREREIEKEVAAAESSDQREEEEEKEDEEEEQEDSEKEEALLADALNLATDQKQTIDRMGTENARLQQRLEQLEAAMSRMGAPLPPQVFPPQNASLLPQNPVPPPQSPNPLPHNVNPLLLQSPLPLNTHANTAPTPQANASPLPPTTGNLLPPTPPPTNGNPLPLTTSTLQGAIFKYAAKPIGFNIPSQKGYKSRKKKCPIDLNISSHFRTITYIF